MEIPLRNPRQQLPQLPALAHGCKPNCTLLQGHFDFRGWPQAGAFRKRLRNPDRQAVAPLLNPGSHAISVSTMSLPLARRKARPRAANVRKLSGERSRAKGESAGARCWREPTRGRRNPITATRRPTFQSLAASAGVVGAGRAEALAKAGPLWRSPCASDRFNSGNDTPRTGRCSTTPAAYTRECGIQGLTPFPPRIGVSDAGV